MILLAATTVSRPTEQSRQAQTLVVILFVCSHAYFLCLLPMASPADVGAVIRGAEPGLTFLLEDAKAPKVVQHGMITKGWDTLRMFARADDTKQDLRKACRDILLLDQGSLEGGRGRRPPC